MQQAKFTYSPSRKVFERQTKTIVEQEEEQVKAIEEHGKQLFNLHALIKKYYDTEKNSPSLLK